MRYLAVLMLVAVAGLPGGCGGSESTTAADGGEDLDHPTTIPVALRGIWRSANYSCTEDDDNGKALMIIGASWLGLYELGGRISEVRQRDATSLVAEFDFESYGEQWKREVKLSLRGPNLIKVFKDEDYPESEEFVYARCQDAQPAVAVEGPWPAGSDCEYIGEVKDGRPYGIGSDNCTNGAKYVGEYKDGKRHGHGTVVFEFGAKYVGEWEDSNMHGQGTYTYADGSNYVGEWKDDDWHGQGTLTLADGTKYVGEWKDGMQHGQGSEYYAGGSVWRKGWWCNDEESDGPCRN